MEFFTIGVYNSTEALFFEKLVKNGIDTFCDIRQRRGVRGAKYSFVNSNRLQQKLNELEIKYGYVQELAPTNEIRSIQRQIDNNNNVLKSERISLGKEFELNYESKILEKFDFELFFNSLYQAGSNRIVLFCVEQYHDACHRSLVAKKLADEFKYKITHL